MKKIKVKHKGVLMNPAKKESHAMTAHLQGTARQGRLKKGTGKPPNRPPMWSF